MFAPLRDLIIKIKYLIGYLQWKGRINLVIYAVPERMGLEHEWKLVVAVPWFEREGHVVEQDSVHNGCLLNLGLIASQSMIVWYHLKIIKTFLPNQ